MVDLAQFLSYAKMLLKSTLVLDTYQNALVPTVTAHLFIKIFFLLLDVADVFTYSKLAR